MVELQLRPCSKALADFAVFGASFASVAGWDGIEGGDVKDLSILTVNFEQRCH
jgi:hypothetical protein